MKKNETLWICPTCGFSAAIPRNAPAATCPAGHRDNAPRDNSTDSPAVGMLQKAANFGRAVFDWSSRGFPTRPAADVDAIYAAHCATCPENLAGECARCGCPVHDSTGAVRNKIKMRVPMADCPRGLFGFADVLFVHRALDVPRWHAERTAGDFAAIGKVCRSTLPPRDLGSARTMLASWRPRLLINRAFSIPANVVDRLASENPDVVFLSINHSSASHVLHHRAILPQHLAFVELAERRSNCYLGTPDVRNPWRLIGGERCVYVANTLPVCGFDSRDLGEPPVVAIVARGDLVKNLPQQLLAIAIANKTRRVRVILSVRDQMRELAELLQRGGVEFELRPWSPHAHYLKTLRDADVVLNATFSDSFGYVAAEALMSGTPVVGSSAIRFTPRPWVADPESPDDMSAKLLAILDDLATHPRETRQHAHDTAVALAANLRTDFETLMRQLIEGKK